MITLNAIKRDGTVSSEINTLRRNGYIPYVLYSKGQQPEIGAIISCELEAAMRAMKPGFLPTTIFSVKDAQGKTRKVIVKEIQYKPTTYQVTHLDFLELVDSNPVRLKIPVELLNTVDCVGIKLGGFLRLAQRHIEVTCLPKDIPSHFEIDVRDLDIYQAKKVLDIQIPDGVKTRVRPEEIVVTVLKK